MIFRVLHYPVKMCFLLLQQAPQSTFSEKIILTFPYMPLKKKKKKKTIFFLTVSTNCNKND